MGKTYIDTSKLKKQYIELSKLKKIYVDTTCYFSAGYELTYTSGGTTYSFNDESKEIADIIKVQKTDTGFYLFAMASGTLKFTGLPDGVFQAFVLGAGSNGSVGSYNQWTEEGYSVGYQRAGAGGAGGKYLTQTITPVENTNYSLTIGQSNGADSSGFGVSSSSGTSKSGGEGGKKEWWDVVHTNTSGGNGSNGVYPFSDSSLGYYGSSAGGGGSANGAGTSGAYAGTPGSAAGYAGTSATAHRGAGGGGAGAPTSGTSIPSAGSGSSGIIIIKFTES